MPMQVRILFDKYATNRRLRTGWGIAYLIDEKILFDAGENGDWLLGNMKDMKVDIGRLEAVVISHDHWDHTRGLWKLLQIKSPLDVYGCPGFSASFKKNVRAHNGNFIEKNGFFEIADNIYVTGEIAGEYGGAPMPEQALVVKTERGITVVTGCAHPGIVNMLEAVVKEFCPDESGGKKEGLYLAFGGFHLMDSNRKAVEAVVKKIIKMGVKNIGPTHCTGEEAEGIFAEKYKNNLISIKVGSVFQV